MLPTRTPDHPGFRVEWWPIAAWLLLGLGGETRIAAAESVLVVPAASVAQHLVAEWPKDVSSDQAEGWQVVDLDAPGALAKVQRTAHAAPDGTVASESGALLTSLAPRSGAPAARRFALRLQPPAGKQTESPFRFEDVSPTSVKLYQGTQPVFVYNHGVISNQKVPERDRRGSRACYVHPVWGLNGEIITDDFPADHYHHHGIFWAWPHVLIGGQEYDLWTYSNIQPKFVRWLYRQVGPVAAVLAVENGWFVGAKQVLTERVWLRAFQSGADERSLDVSLVLIPGEQGVTLRGAEGKSYGGLTMRFDVWPRRDAVVRAPERTTRFVGTSDASAEDLTNTRLPWADLCAQFPGSPQRSGAAVFVHPNHPDNPPSWLTRCYGALCVGYPGVEAKTFAAGQPFRLDYRVWIHKSEVEQPRLASEYGGFCSGAKPVWQAQP